MLASLRRLMVAGAAVLAAGAFAVPAQAAAPAPAPHVPAHRTAGKPHFTPVMGAGQPSAATSTRSPLANLTNGNGNLLFGGAPVQDTPTIYLDFWGTEWTTPTADAAGFTTTQAQAYVGAFVNDVGASPWLHSQTQYCDAPAIADDISACAGRTHAGVPGAVPSSHIITDTGTEPSASLTLAQIRAEADTAAGVFGINPNDFNENILVLTPSTKSVFTFDNQHFFCGFHDFTAASVYSYIPWIPDESGCPTNRVNATNDSFGHGHFDGFSMVIGHEVAETITDPLPGIQDSAGNVFFGWIDPTPSGQINETGDKCTNLPPPVTWPPANQTFASNNFYAVQPLWTDAGATCTMQDLGGVISGHAAITARDATHRDVFVRGGDGQVYWKTATGDNWSGWMSLGGSTPSSPAAVSWDANRIDLFVRGGDNQLWHKSWTPAGWATTWDGLGGSIIGGAAVASWASNRLDVFVVGNDRQLYHKSWNGSNWSGYDGRGGFITADPAAVSWGFNRIDVFVRGGDNAMWHQAWDGNNWTGYDGLGGGFISGFGAASTGVGELQVFGLGGDHQIYRKTFSGAWGGFVSLEGAWPTDPATISPPSTGTRLIELFMLGNTTNSVERLILGI
jgi:hypothetical protein